MSRNYDNWERLVAAVIKREQLWELFHAQSRSPSVLSEASDLSSVSGLEDVSPVNKSGLISFPGYEHVLDFDDLCRSPAEIIGRGNFGLVYCVKMDSRLTFAVKRLKVFDISRQDFETRMGIIGDVQQENVAALRAYFYSSTEKLVIYDYYSGGNVSALLHGKNGENRAHVDWKTRLRIAIGAALGIGHIHTQNGGKLAHGNIKSSNIFLNSQQYSLISDLGLANMIPATYPQSSRCYAPEVKGTQDVSQASDVYSFGIVLLELLTRKCPDVSFGHESVDLAKLVNSVSRKEWNKKVFDGDLLSNPGIRKEIVRMLEIGISCVAKSPKKRPKMSLVLKMMEDIFMMNMENQDNIKSGSMMTAGKQVSSHAKSSELVFLGDGNPTFDFDDLLRAPAKVLGKGTFGTLYRVILENGNIMSVRRLRDVTVTKTEFQQHIETMGRIRQKNVAKLKAYLYCRDEKLLVNDYHNQESLYSMLHSSGYSGKRPLDWDARLKIALGAANGIAHIHAQSGQKLVHGNIKTSNILLDEQQNAIVSDVGLRNLVSPMAYSVSCLNSGYYGPEVTNNSKVSQASDVYSFGVLLLELVSGQKPHTKYKGKAMHLVQKTEVVLRQERAAEVFDVELVRYGNVEEEMMEMMQIAMNCVDRDPSRRPKMIDVLLMLREVRGTVTARSRLQGLLSSRH